jgi:hypothetical protein
MLPIGDITHQKKSGQEEIFLRLQHALLWVLAYLMKMAPMQLRNLGE